MTTKVHSTPELRGLTNDWLKLLSEGKCTESQQKSAAWVLAERIRRLENTDRAHQALQIARIAASKEQLTRLLKHNPELLETALEAYGSD